MGVTLAVRPQPTPAADPDLDWLRGRTVVHKIVIGLIDPHACVLVLMQELKRSGGQLRALALNATGGGLFDAVLQVTDVSPKTARGMVDRIAANSAVTSAAIEHVLIR